MDTTRIRLDIPVPPAPLLEQAVGYHSDRHPRYLALWWEPCGDEVMVSDGFISFTGHWPGYLTYVQHPRVYPHLAPYNLGSSECEAELRLVIDRQEMAAFILPPDQAGKLLSDQWEAGNLPPIPQVLSLESLEAVVTEIAAHWQPPSPADLLERMQDDRRAVQALRAWLDQTSHLTGGAHHEQPYHA